MLNSVEVGGGRWEIETIGYKMGSGHMAHHGDYSQSFVIIVNGK